MQKNLIRLAVIALLSINVIACSSAFVAGRAVPAVRVNITDLAQKELRQAISSSLHLSNVRISAFALTKKHTLVVEKSTLEGFDLDTPTVFSLYKEGTKCLLENNKTTKQTILGNTSCISL